MINHIIDHWKGWLSKNGFDLGEPSCWSCGNGFNGRYDVDNPKATMKQVYDKWSKAPLQKCHIIAKQFGGSDEPDNIFLMCSSCHDKAPNTKNKEIFMKWVSSQNHYVSTLDEMQKEMNLYGMDFVELFEIVKESEFITGDIGLHLNQKDGGVKLTLSTLVGLADEYKKSKSL